MRESSVAERNSDLDDGIPGGKRIPDLNEGIERVAELTPRLNEGIPGWRSHLGLNEGIDSGPAHPPSE